MNIDLIVSSTLGSIRVIVMAILGSYMCARSGRYLANSEDIKAAVFFGLGLCLMVAAIKGV